MRGERDIFKTTTILIALSFTSILFLSIASLFLIVGPSDILTSLSSPEMAYSLKLSVMTASISTFLVMLFSIPTGYALSRFDFPGKIIAKSIIDLPIAFPELVLGLALLLLFGQTFIGGTLEALGIQIVFTKTGIVVAQIFTAFPYAVRIIYSTFKDIDPRYEFVSRSLGYGDFETFRKVTLPLARTGLFASTIIAFARCIGAFGAVLILAGGSYMNTDVLPISLYLNLSYGNLPMAITNGIVLVVISFVAIFTLEKFEGGHI
ncbi:MAG: ABC transporter permease [Euryarchaeota archaeon]|nr:ABC transporter permease [Euryarchaeota archaeon]